jgi:hypothetical protein
MPESMPDVIGWYHHHEIQIYRDVNNDRPWRVVFDYCPLANESGECWIDPTGEPVVVPYPEERERSLALAEDAAQGLAQRKYFVHLPFQRIKWHPVVGV